MNNKKMLQIMQKKMNLLQRNLKAICSKFVIHKEIIKKCLAYFLVDENTLCVDTLSIACLFTTFLYIFPRENTVASFCISESTTENICSAELSVDLTGFDLGTEEIALNLSMDSMCFY
jgi:hypothetical protein